MIKPLMFLTLLFSSFSIADTAQIEVDNMKEVFGRINALQRKYKKTLVVFDLDNTVIAAKKALGSDQWFSWKMGLYKENPEAQKEVLKWLDFLMIHTPQRLTEKNVPFEIKKLQDKKIPVIALTSRNPKYRFATQDALNSFKINFKKTAIGKSPILMTPYKDSGRKVSYQDGVFMTQGLHKGKMLKSLLAKYKAANYFEQIIFIDDHSKNTSRVYESFKFSNTDILTIRYSKEDAKVLEFKNSVELKKKADSQLKSLKKSLSYAFGKAPKLI